MIYWTDDGLINAYNLTKHIFINNIAIYHNFSISVIFAFAPANCFQPTKNVLDTMRKLDAKHQLGMALLF